MLAYHSDVKVKKKYVDRVKAHYKADEIIQGTYWENGKGCAVGCTMEMSTDVHRAMERELGVPAELAYLEDRFFEELKNGDAKKFPLRFLKAIKPGADLSLITANFMVWQFEDKKYGLKNIKKVQEDKEVYGLCEEIVNLYKRKLKANTPTEKEFEELSYKIETARSSAAYWAGSKALAWDWARSWSGAGAGSEIRIQAEARTEDEARAEAAGAKYWANAWAWTVADADYEKTYEEFTKAGADKLISLLKET